MTTADGVRARQTLADIKAWLAGEFPEAVHLVTAPVIEEWSVVWIVNPDGRGTPMRIEGIVSGSPTKDDGGTVRTSPVILLDRQFGWARTSNRIYRLGQQAGIEIP